MIAVGSTTAVVNSRSLEALGGVLDTTLVADMGWVGEEKLANSAVAAERILLCMTVVVEGLLLMLQEDAARKDATLSMAIVVG